jgi:diaminopimelate decarboxylase
MGETVAFCDAYLTVRDGRLCLDGADLVDLAAGVETPFFVFSERRLRDNVAAVRGAFAARHPRSEVFFASKACSNLWFLDVVRDAGASVEVNSGGELDKALRAGFAPPQIVFNGVAKTRTEIAAAVRLGVRALLVDSLCELDRIGAVAAELGTIAEVAPRIDVHVPALTHPGLETAFGGKAGIDRDDAAEAFRRAAADPWLDPAGLHLHVGSQIASVAPYRQAVETALDLVAEVEAAAGLRLRFLDAGGGFAVPYAEAGIPSAAGASTAAPYASAPGVAAAGAGVASTVPAPATPPAGHYFASEVTLDEYAAAVCTPLLARRPDLALFLEPGRSIAATTGVLVTRVESEKTKRVRDGAGRVVGEQRWLTIDAGFNTLLEHTNYAWYFRAAVAGRAGEPSDTPFRLAGPLCDGGDVYAGDGASPFRLFPAGTGPGDLVVFRDVGGYTLEMMNDYNARPRAAAYAVTSAGEVVEVRRRETSDDLMRLDRVPRRDGAQ